MTIQTERDYLAALAELVALDEERDRSLAEIRRDEQGAITRAQTLQRRETEQVAALSQRAQRLESDVDRCLGRAGAQRPVPPSSVEPTSIKDLQQGLDAVTRDMRSLNQTLDWLERHRPSQDVVRALPQPPAAGATQVGNAAPIASSAPAPPIPVGSGLSRPVLFAVIGVALVLLIILIVLLR